MNFREWFELHDVPITWLVVLVLVGVACASMWWREKFGRHD